MVVSCFRTERPVDPVEDQWASSAMVAGALYHEHDSHLTPADVVHALARERQKLGVKICISTEPCEDIVNRHGNLQSEPSRLPKPTGWNQRAKVKRLATKWNF
jgi:hypothetical protein